MNYNLSENDLVNYKQTNFSTESNNINIINNINNKLNISGASKNKSPEHLIEIELKNIHMLILQRSLYILKRRFDQNKKELELIYEKYKDKKYKKLKCISTRHLIDLYNEIMSIIQINLLPYENFNELLTADLMSGFNKGKYSEIINSLTQFTKKNIEKYNKIFYENKLKKKMLKKIPKLEPIEVTQQVNIIHLNKRGEIIDDFEKMIENNKKIDINEMIFTIIEDDVSIIDNKRLLYNDVIPLIIADFLQEKMKNNIYIGIILSTSFSKENDELNENIKVMYDKEIIKKYNNLNRIDPKEEKNDKLKNLLFEANNIETQIKIYKKLIVENSLKGIESTNLIKMIQILNDKKLLLENKINDINIKKYSTSNNIIISKNNINNEKYSHTVNTNNNLPSIESIHELPKLNKSKSSVSIHMPLISKKLSKEQVRENNILEIFLFYCKQHSFLGKTPTIDSVLEKEKYMSLCEFINFCRDFKIFKEKNIDKIKEIKNEEKIREMFRKKRNRQKKDNKAVNDIFIKNTKKANMSFDEFKIALNKLSIILNEENKQSIKEQITINQLRLQELSEKEKIIKEKKNQKKRILKNVVNDQNKNDEEAKNNEQNNNEIINLITNQNTNNQELKDNNKNNEEINDENKNKEENKNIKNTFIYKTKELQAKYGYKNLIDNNRYNQPKKQNQKEIKKDENSIFIEAKQNIEKNISKLKDDYKILENKSPSQLEEELYIFLEIDDNIAYRRKMVGHVQPFMIRGKDTRNPEKNVKYPIKFEPKNIRNMYDLLMQRSEDLKKEKELKKMKEKDIQYSQRKNIFNKDIKKLENDYDEKIKKDNYKQLRKDEEDYLKVKSGNLTWKIIQEGDYKTFLLNKDSDKYNSNNTSNKSNKNIQSKVNDIFLNHSNIYFEKEEKDFLNKIYGSQSIKLSHNYDAYIHNLKLQKNKNFAKNTHLSVESNKRYKLGK